MDLGEYLARAYDYMYWANARYIKVAEGLPGEELHRSQGHSWDSVHSVLVHMMSSETVWLSRWRGEAPTAHLDAGQLPTVEALRERWTAVERQMRDFVARQNDESLAAPLTYSNFRGETFRVPLWQMLMHVPNHETHHRGELAAMFALMNVAHPEEEVIQYFLNSSGQKRF
jgi:uncharacterized damage-inducible protein DinB